jgi:TPR repeat protein
MTGSGNGLHDFRLFADQGDAVAQFHYDVVLWQGDGIPMNKSLVARYLKLSAIQGFVAAQFNSDVLLLKGNEISMNKSLAVHCFRLSADQGLICTQRKYAKSLLDCVDV